MSDSAVQNLLKRLETVTARLEQVEKQIASGAASSHAAPAASGHSSSDDDSSVSPSVQDYDALIDEFIVPFVALSNELGNNELKTQVAKVEAAIRAQRQFLVVASKSKKPDVPTFSKLLEQTNSALQEVVQIREKAGKVNNQFNQLSTLSEGISALGWVAAPPTPGPFVNEARASSEFYSNKILMESKKTGDQKQIEWVQKWNGFLKELAVYIKKHHTTDVAWNPRGGDASSASAAAPSKAAGGPPPPPKALPPPVADTGAKAPDTNALFAALNKGGDITQGLKKVTKDMKTKNDPTRSSVVPATAAAPKATSKPAQAKKGKPVVELQGNKWAVEWQENNNNVEIKDTETKHTVYIYKCENTVVKITGKINNVSIDGCKKVAVVFDTAISACEVVNSQSVEIQILNKVPSVAIDKCTGVSVYLSKTALETEIVTSKSDSLNVLIPDPAGSPDPVEIAIPEQYKTLIVNNRTVTTPVEHV